MKRLSLILVLVALAAGGAWWWRPGSPAPAVDFSLTGHHGRTVTRADLAGRTVLLYFGYTFCPDVCPTELGYLARVLNTLGPEAERVQPVLVTIDPGRDTVAKLADYVPLYHPRLLGLTGPPEAVAQLAARLGVRYQRADVATAKPGYYLMDHTAFTYVLDAQGRLVATIDSHATPVAEAAAIIRRHLP